MQGKPEHPPHHAFSIQSVLPTPTGCHAEQCKVAGLRQEDLARMLGVSRQTIIAIENNKYDPTLALAIKLARLLDLHVDELFFLDE